MKSTPSTFADFNFSADIMKAITELGYETPSPIQLEALPILMKGNTDFIGLAATGTGKTAAFSIPMLEKMNPAKKGVQGLVLCPTRELAKQVSEQINLLARYKKTKAIAIYGGSDYAGQLRALKEGVSIVVGTPGRIIDHIERKTLNLNSLQTVILDEADEMISMGFKEEIETILEAVSQEEKHQTWMFSATMNRDIRRIADQFLHNPEQVSIAKPVGKAASITQYYFDVHEDQKPQIVENLIDSVQDFHGLIFCQTKALVIDLTQSLKAHGFAADCLHGDMEQPARERAMKAFKSKQCTVMVCTDVAARGIDVKDLSHVINYSLPRELENYVHRIGRTGRGGKEGIAWNLVNPSHRGLIPRIEKLTQAKMIRATVPNADAILKLKVARSLTDFNKPIPEEKGATQGATFIKGLLLETGWKEVLDLMSKEEIAARFLAKTLKVDTIKQSIHDAPRDGTREERRGSYMERTSGRGSRGGFGAREGRGGFSGRGGYEGGGRSRKPEFSTFAPRGGDRDRARGDRPSFSDRPAPRTARASSEVASFSGNVKGGFAAKAKPVPSANFSAAAAGLSTSASSTKSTPWRRK